MMSWACLEQIDYTNDLLLLQPNTTNTDSIGRMFQRPAEPEHKFKMAVQMFKSVPFLFYYQKYFPSIPIPKSKVFSFECEKRDHIKYPWENPWRIG